MQLTDESLALTLQKVNPKKSLSIQVRQSKEIARKHTVLQGISLPLQAEFRSLGVGIRTSLTRGTGPLLKKRTSKGIHLPSRVRGAQGGFSRRTHIIATLVQAAALWGTPGAEVSRRDLQSLETAVLHSLWGTSRPGRAKEIIFVLLVQGHRVSPHMKITYDRVCWLLRARQAPFRLWCSRALKLGKRRYDPLHQDRFNEPSWSWRALAGGRRIIGGSGMCPGCPKK